MRFALGLWSLAVALGAPAVARACMPGCSGYHLTFTSPTGAGTTVDQSVTITWQDVVDGPQATFDLMVSDAPVPVYPMHSFPAQLPGEILALGLPAVGQSSYVWTTASRAPGTYFLYAVFHNAPFNTLVMPFAAVAVAHGQTASATVLIGSPRGLNAVAGTVSIGLDALAPGAGPGAVVDVYVGSPPDAADGTLIASALPLQAGQTLQWESSGQPAGSYVFKAVAHDATGTLATALSPGMVQVGNPPASASSGCTSGSGPVGWLALCAAAFLLRRKRG